MKSLYKIFLLGLCVSLIFITNGQGTSTLTSHTPVDICLRKASSDTLQIRLLPHTHFTGLVSLQFTLAWPDSVNITVDSLIQRQIESEYLPLEMLTDVRDTLNGTVYQPFMGLGLTRMDSVGASWTGGDAVVIASLVVSDVEADFRIINDAWTNTHNADYYIELDTLEATGEYIGNCNPFRLASSTMNCLDSDFCISFSAEDSLSGAKGIEIAIAYDGTKVTPTGNLVLGNDLVNPSYVQPHVNTALPDTVRVTLALNGSPSSTWDGVGEIFCLEFSRLPSFEEGECLFSTTELRVSYSPFPSSMYYVDEGKLTVYKDSTFIGQVRHRSGIPLRMDSIYGIQTTVRLMDSSCSPAVDSTFVDELGSYEVPLQNHEAFQLIRDIPDTVDIMPVITGQDSWLILQFLTSTRPDTFPIEQVLSMDVDQNGGIDSGDITETNLRSTSTRLEFPQLWNAGTGTPSLDWVFVDSLTLATNPAYQAPNYNKYAVPIPPMCLDMPVTYTNTCPEIEPRTYIAILLGDVDESYTTASSALRTSSSHTLIVALSELEAINDSTFSVPLYVVGNKIVSVNMRMDYDTDVLKASSAFHSPHSHIEAGYNHFGDESIRLSAYATTGFFSSLSPVGRFQFTTQAPTITASDLGAISGYVNGLPVAVEIQSGCGRDVFEPNNDELAAAPVPILGVNRNARICPKGDVDWYTFNLEPHKPNVLIRLSNLARNYQLKVYNDLGNLISSSNQPDTLQEVLVLNYYTAGTYYIEVSGSSIEDYSSAHPYNLTVMRQNQAFVIRDSSMQTLGFNDNASTHFIRPSVHLFPNPTDGDVTIVSQGIKSSLLSFELLSIEGKTLLKGTKPLNNLGTTSLSLDEYPEGMYLIKVEADGYTFPYKLIKQ